MAVLQTFSENLNAFRDAFRLDAQGWIICAAVLIVTVVRSGITYSFGVFVVKLEDVYHRPMAEQNWIGTLSFCISLSCAPISVAFIRCLKYRGYRWGGLIGTVILTVSCIGSSFVHALEWMFLTHSFFYGVGSSLIYMASSLVIGEYFDKNHKYHVLATSILLCGYPIGSLLFNPINAFLVTKWGWRVAFRCASFLIFISGIVCSLQFKAKETPNMQLLEEEPEDAPPRPETPPPSYSPPPPMTYKEKAAKMYDENCITKETFRSIKERPEIALWYFGNLLSYLGFFMPFVNLEFYMKTHGIDPPRSSWAITLLSFAECLTYIIASWFGDYLKGRLIYVNVIAAAGLSFICVVWPSIDVNYTVICFISIAMGGCLGLTIVYTYAASGEVTHLPIDHAWSFTNLWSGIGILLGPFFSGTIYDIRGSYDDVFYTVGALYLLNAVMFGLIPVIGLIRERYRTDIYKDMGGQADHVETLRISNKRTLSKSSLVNGDVDGGPPLPEYGTMATVTPQVPVRPPPPSHELIRQNSKTFNNAFDGY